MTTLITKDEVLKMAKEAGLRQHIPFWSDSEVAVALEAFAKLVEDKVRQEIIEKNAPVIKKVNEHIQELQDAVKAEREACANLCWKSADDNAFVNAYNQKRLDLLCSELIRSRGLKGQS